MTELLSAHDYEVADNRDELPFCVSQKGERGDMHEKPEKRDVVDDINPGHDDEKIMEEQVHEKPEERDGASNSSLTYHTRQSSTKTEAVLRYVEFPIFNQLVQFVTPLSNTGPVKPEMRDGMTNINIEGRYDDTTRRWWRRKCASSLSRET
jgi:hypothetical protein